MTSGSAQKLLIEISLDNLSYCVKNQTNNQVVAFKSIPLDTLKAMDQQLDLIFDKETKLNSSFDHVLILHNNNLNTFVPETLFDETALGSYLQYNVKVFPTDYFDFDSLEVLKMKNIYVPYVVFNNYFLDRFGSFHFEHLYTNLVQLLTARSTNIMNTKFYVHIRVDRFEIIIIENGKLLFFNSYDYQTKEDFIYYVLFVMEQLQLSPQEQKVELIGLIDSESVLYQIIYQYVRNVSILDLKSLASTLLVDEKHLQQHFILLQS